MRNIERIAFWFGIGNLVLGAMSMLSPFVKARTTKNPIKRMIYKRQQRKIINTGTGYLLGQLGAVNPPHAVLHSALGAAGIATRRNQKLAVPYFALSTLLFAAMAVMGWMKVGYRPGIKNVSGFAMDRRGNIFTSLMGLGTLAMTAIPLIQSIRDRASRQDVEKGLEMASAGLTE